MRGESELLAGRWLLPRAHASSPRYCHVELKMGVSWLCSRYRFIKAIGDGGQGGVYRYEDMHTQQHVVVKEYGQIDGRWAPGAAGKCAGEGRRC